MTPDQRIAQLERTVADLSQQIKQLSNNTTIPFNVEKAFRNRLKLNKNAQEEITDVTTDFPANPLSESVNEAGTSSYNVMAAPDIVLSVRLPNGTLVAVGAFDY